MARTAASPRKNAPAFAQTWDETDAAFLDPTSIPIQRAPRAWERKQQLKTTSNGKKKEIWKRHNTRSRASESTTNEDPERDVRARAVKRQQRLSPKAIEKSATSSFGKMRAFKATRWDRRRSVLPRKKTMCDNNESFEAGDEEEQDTTITDAGDESFSEIGVDGVRAELQEAPLLPEGEDRRGTFTFALEEDEIAPAGTEDASFGMENAEDDATIARLFRSPTKPTTGSAENLSYPELPSLPECDDEATFDTTPAKPDSPTRAAPSADEDTPVVCEPSTLYPSLPDEDLRAEPMLDCQPSPSENQDVAFPAVEEAHEVHDELDDDELAVEFNSPDEEFTEASLQLNLQQEMEVEDPTVLDEGEDLPGGTITQEPSGDAQADTHDLMEDITSGLTLGPVIPSSREPTPRKLRSPSPPPRTETGPEDATMTFAFDDDTALLKDFISRAAASKANKAENIARRESLQNRRDSDVVRHALASPRKALEDKDPNSPSKYDNEATLDLSQTLTLKMEPSPPLSPSKSPSKVPAGNDAEEDDSKTDRTSRRSARTKKSRLPGPSSIPTGPPKIAVKRDGGDPVILKKTDTQQLSLLTRSNTRKNKQGAVNVNVRLLKLSADARTAEDPTPDTTTDTAEVVAQVPGKKYVRWDAQLTYFQADTEALADALAEAESLATPDELSAAPPSTLPTKLKAPKLGPKVVIPKVASTTTSTPKVRKVRNLGSANGTPGKGLLNPASLLPDISLDAADDSSEKLRAPRPRVSKKKAAGVDITSAPAPSESGLPALELAPVGIETGKPAAATTATTTAAKERKSRLATPRKVKLPQLASASASSAVEGKENAKSGIKSATPKKGIPLPSAVGAPSSTETVPGATGLPRRRGRKVL